MECPYRLTLVPPRAAATLERLRDSREPSLLVDFLRSVDLSGKGINLSCCAELLPLLARMLDSHFEECDAACSPQGPWVTEMAHPSSAPPWLLRYVVTALNSVKTLFELFSLAILQTRKLHERGGPVQKDIVWEERCVLLRGGAPTQATARH